MIEVRTYHLPPTPLMPNNPLPLLHYPGLLLTIPSLSSAHSPNPSPSPIQPSALHHHFASNNWRTQWIFRYGPTQVSHYHSRAHECMAVLTGHARIRFGVADTSPDPDQNTYGTDYEPGGIELHAEAGDVFILPAGTAHKTYEALPEAEFVLLTPGNGHGVPGPDPARTLDEVRLDGFTMMGAYPEGSGEWDFPSGGEDVGAYERVWAVEKPQRDPILGLAREGTCGQW